MPLSGRVIAVTGPCPERLGRVLTDLGAEVVAVPMLEIVDGDRTVLSSALADCQPGDWLVVTSQHGARLAGPLVAATPGIRVGAIGPRTAEVVTEYALRAPDLVPDVHVAEAFAASFPPATPGQRVVLAQADRARPVLAARLGDVGYVVHRVVAYKIVDRVASPTEVDALSRADAVLFASGSAAASWASQPALPLPGVVVAIGPVTARRVVSCGLGTPHVATDFHLDGLVAATVGAFGG